MADTDNQQQNIEKLDKETIANIKKELLERREKIENDMEDIAKKDDHEKDGIAAAFPEYGDKADENAQEISEYSTNLEAERILEGILKDINSSLKRIEDGTYGICKYCNQDIGKKRMIARPVASACVSCKTKLQNS